MWTKMALMWQNKTRENVLKYKPTQLLDKFIYLILLYSLFVWNFNIKRYYPGLQSCPKSPTIKLTINIEK